MIPEISSSAHAKKSRLGTIRSASCPALIRPFLPSSFENQVVFSVHSRSAVSAIEAIVALGTSRKPPTVLPVTNQASEIQGL